MIRLPLAPALLTLSLLATPIPVMAQQQTSNSAEQAETGKGVQRIRNVQIKRGDSCPKATSDDEIVVCGTLEEPYRIPKDLRETKKDAAQQSWVNRTETIDEAGRVAGGLPNTCSPVGSGGQTGCVSKMLRDYAADKRQQKAEASSVP